MELTTSEKIKIIVKRKGMKLEDLAVKTEQTRQNLSNKLARDNFTEKEIRKIAEALDCDYEAHFVLRDSGERL